MRVRLPSSRQRRGLSLVEVMTALVLVAVGLLGMAGSSALVVRRSADVDAARRAVRAASLRMALLAAAGCAGARDGTAGSPASVLVERWTVAAAGGGARLVRVEVEWTERGARRGFVLRSALLC